MSKTIMIVDDSASLRQLLNIALCGAGYEVIEACDGMDALGKLNGQKVHLVISDINMPNMDGIAFVKKLKQLPAYKFTPVIMLTFGLQEGKKQEDQKQEARAAGVKAWMVKPFQSAQMLEAVSKLVMP
jgi:two-component system chemotaxis response regulator CheY